MGFTLEITGSVFNFTTFLTQYAKKLKCVVPLKKQLNLLFEASFKTRSCYEYKAKV